MSMLNIAHPSHSSPSRSERFALHQKDRLVGFAAQHRVVAFEEHDVGSIGAKPREYKINIAILETTLQKHKTRTGKVYLTWKPLQIGEDQPEVVFRRHGGELVANGGITNNSLQVYFADMKRGPSVSSYRKPVKLRPILDRDGASLGPNACVIRGGNSLLG